LTTPARDVLAEVSAPPGHELEASGFLVSFEDPAPGTGIATGTLMILLDGDDITGQFDTSPSGATFTPTTARARARAHAF
jgi:hypothetical protein